MKKGKRRKVVSWLLILSILLSSFLGAGGVGNTAYAAKTTNLDNKKSSGSKGSTASSEVTEVETTVHPESGERVTVLETTSGEVKATYNPKTNEVSTTVAKGSRKATTIDPVTKQVTVVDLTTGTLVAVLDPKSGKVKTSEKEIIETLEANSTQATKEKPSVKDEKKTIPTSVEEESTLPSSTEVDIVTGQAIPSSSAHETEKEEDKKSEDTEDSKYPSTSLAPTTRVPEPSSLSKETKPASIIPTEDMEKIKSLPKINGVTVPLTRAAKYRSRGSVPAVDELVIDSFVYSKKNK